MKCFKCGKEGRIAKGCQKKGHQAVVCFRCNRKGHISRLCPEKNGGIMTDIICFGCGQKGHIAAQCLDRKDAHSVPRLEADTSEGRGKCMRLVSTTGDPLDKEL